MVLNFIWPHLNTKCMPGDRRRRRRDGGLANWHGGRPTGVGVSSPVRGAARSAGWPGCRRRTSTGRSCVTRPPPLDAVSVAVATSSVFSFCALTNTNWNMKNESMGYISGAARWNHEITVCHTQLPLNNCTRKMEESEMNIVASYVCWWRQVLHGTNKTCTRFDN